MNPRELCRAMFDAAVARAQPAVCLPPHLPAPPPRPADRARLRQVGRAHGGGVRSATTSTAACSTPERLVGICVTRHGYGRPLRRIRCVEAGHPVPDEAGLDGNRRRSGARRAKPGRTISRSCSSRAAAPPTGSRRPSGLTIADKQALTKALLASGAPISDINTVRKHLSRIKGGRLAARLYPAPSLTLCISDVPGDDPSLIASGPTVPDPTHRRRCARAAAALEHRHSRASAGRARRPGRRDAEAGRSRLRARRSSASSRARPNSLAGGRGDRPTPPATRWRCSATRWRARPPRSAHAHGRMAVEALREAAGASLFLSGGELTVTVRGNGRGGPNQEYALALALAIDGAPGNHRACRRHRRRPTAAAERRATRPAPSRTPPRSRAPGSRASMPPIS